MTDIEKNFEENKDKMKIGFCIQIETYLEILDITFDELQKNIVDNEKLFENLPLGDWQNAVDRIKADISFLFVLIEKDLENKKYNTCDYLLKYNT